MKELKTFTTGKGTYDSFPDKTARAELPKKLSRPATAQVGDYLRIKAIGEDGTMEVEAVPAPTGGDVDLTGYATEVWVQELLAQFPTFKIEVVQELPATGEEKTIYLVPFADDSGSYLEYLYVNGVWEVVGSGQNSGENPTGGGLSTAQIDALHGMFQVCAFAKDDVSAEYNAFLTAFGVSAGGGETEPDTPVEPDEPVTPEGVASINYLAARTDGAATAGANYIEPDNGYIIITNTGGHIGLDAGVKNLFAWPLISGKTYDISISNSDTANCYFGLCASTLDVTPVKGEITTVTDTVVRNIASWTTVAAGSANPYSHTAGDNEYLLFWPNKAGVLTITAEVTA